MLTRRRLLAGTFAAIATPLAAGAQQMVKIARIGWLGDDPTRAPHLREAFLQGLRDLGYVEGRNFILERRYHEGKLDRLPALATELVALNAAVIVATGTPNALAAKQATRTVPIVFAAASDPVSSGLVSGLARPGAMSRGYRSSPRSSSASAWNCSGRPFRRSVGSLPSGSRANGRKRTCSGEQKSRRDR